MSVGPPAGNGYPHFVYRDHPIKSYPLERGALRFEPFHSMDLKLCRQGEFARCHELPYQRMALAPLYLLTRQPLEIIERGLPPIAPLKVAEGSDKPRVRLLVQSNPPLPFGEQELDIASGGHLRGDQFRIIRQYPCRDVHPGPVAARVFHLWGIAFLFRRQVRRQEIPPEKDVQFYLGEGQHIGLSCLPSIL